MTNPSGGTSSKDMTISGTATAVIVNECSPAPPRNTTTAPPRTQRGVGGARERGGGQRGRERLSPSQQLQEVKQPTGQSASALNESLSGRWGRGGALMAADTDVASTFLFYSC